MQSKDNTKRGPGPEPETLRLGGSWKGRLRDALRRQRPEKGWPKKPKRNKKHKKNK